MIGLLAFTPASAWSQAQTVIFLNDAAGNLYAGSIAGTSKPVMMLVDSNGSGDPSRGWAGQLAAANGYIYVGYGPALNGHPFAGVSHPGARTNLDTNNSGDS